MMKSVFEYVLRRLGLKKYTLGPAIIINAYTGERIDIEIVSITYKKFKDITNRDANMEGYTYSEDLKNVLIGMYGYIADNDDVTIINFKFLPL